MGGRQRLYQKDKRITIVLEEALHDKIVAIAKSKGLTVSRLLALTCKKVFSQPMPVRKEEVKPVASARKLALEDISLEHYTAPS